MSKEEAITAMMTPSAQVKLAALRTMRAEILAVARDNATAASGEQFLLDMVVLGVLNRTLRLLRGFCNLIEDGNFVAAAPLVRMQLDTYLRFLAAGHAADMHEFSEALLGGTPVRKLKAKDGKLMRDARLVEIAAQDDPWVKTVYEQTSGYIHFSEKHVFSSVKADPTKPNEFTFRISDRDDEEISALYEDAIDRFRDCTMLILGLLRAWVAIKQEAHEELGGEGD